MSAPAPAGQDKAHEHDRADQGYDRRGEPGSRLRAPGVTRRS